MCTNPIHLIDSMEIEAHHLGKYTNFYNLIAARWPTVDRQRNKSLQVIRWILLRKQAQVFFDRAKFLGCNPFGTISRVVRMGRGLQWPFPIRDIVNLLQELPTCDHCGDLDTLKDILQEEVSLVGRLNLEVGRHAIVRFIGEPVSHLEYLEDPMRFFTNLAEVVKTIPVAILRSLL